jgi:hypothetical protein
MKNARICIRPDLRSKLYRYKLHYRSARNRANSSPAHPNLLSHERRRFQQQKELVVESTRYVAQQTVRKLPNISEKQFGSKALFQVDIFES